MKKVIYTLVLLAAVIGAKAQINQYFWLDGKLMLGTQIAATDSVTYEYVDTDSIMLYFPQTAIIHDTIIVHDTVYITDEEGGLTGRFSVSATTTVQFSKGNLQYKASTNTWRFAEPQYDVADYDNTKIGASDSTWIDLFGWGTGNNPTFTSHTATDYSTFVDWGANAISNGGNTANTWRTLSKDEWMYLFNTRANAANLYGQGSVNGMNGVILLPDNWTLPTGISFVSGIGYSNNVYTTAQWSVMESAGAVFLPAGGGRDGATVVSIGEEVRYWSSTEVDSEHAYYMYFNTTRYNPESSNYRDRGQSVRLVR